MSKCKRDPLIWQVGIEAAMEQHDGLVHAFIQRQGGGPISYDETLQAGRIGLWRALLRYDPGRGTAFSTYAWLAICRPIHQAVQVSHREKINDWQGEVPASWYGPDPEEWVEQELVRQALSELVGQLPDRLHEVIVSRYGLRGHPRRTLKQIGEKLAVCKERVRQLQQEGLVWLRHPAHSWQLRQLLDKNTTTDYQEVLAQNAALRRRSRRRRK